MNRLSLLVVALLVLSCSPKAEQQYLRPTVPEKTIDDGNGATSQYFKPQADILFVIDNSVSMGIFQDNLAANIQQFIDTFLTNSILDWHVGVVSTSMERGQPDCCGILAGTTKVVHRQTPNAGAVLRQNILLGTDGSSNELSFAPVVAALTPPLVTNQNAGFLRDDALLVVIFITDADDRGRERPRQVYDFLFSLKNNDPRKFLAFGALSWSLYDCPSPLEIGDAERLREFLGYFPNHNTNLMNLCATDFGQKLSDFAMQIVDNTSREILLTRIPQEGTIQVLYGQAELPKDAKLGWAYNKSRNAVVLGEDIDWTSQSSGTELRVIYKTADIPRASNL